MDQGASSSNMNEETNPNDKDLRAKMYQALQKFNIKQVDVAKETGIHHSTLSLWLQGKVKGHFIKIEDTLNQWLENLYSNKPRYTTLNRLTDKQYNVKSTIISTTSPLDHQTHKVELIPVTIEMEFEGKKQWQYVMWNLFQPYLTPEAYSKLLCDQNSMYTPFEAHISQTIHQAVQQFVCLKDAQQKTRINLLQPCLRTMELDVHLDNISFKDRFEWDIAEPLNSPQEFAGSLCDQLELNCDFYVKIVHQIKQQILIYRKLRLRSQEPKDSTSGNKTNVPGFLKDVPDTKVTLENYLRINLEQQFVWQPQVQILDADQIRRHQRLEERKQRYTRRLR